MKEGEGEGEVKSFCFFYENCLLFDCCIQCFVRVCVQYSEIMRMCSMEDVALSKEKKSHSCDHSFYGQISVCSKAYVQSYSMEI